MALNRNPNGAQRFEEILGEDCKAQQVLRLVTIFLNSLGGVNSITRKTQVSFKHGRAFA